MRFILPALLFTFILAGFANAAIIYVDNSVGCPSTRGVYCSIQNGINAVTQAGDIVRIRTGTGVYSETASRTSGPDGNAGAPIIIEPDTGNTPVLRNASANSAVGVITLTNVKYWTIRNLNFDASGVGATSKNAIYLKTTGRDVDGLVVSGNTFTYWGGTNQGGAAGNGENVTAAATVRIDGGSGYYITATITGNTFTNNKQTAININRSRNAIASNNTITGMRCGPNTPGYYQSETGIAIGDEGINPIVTGNTISSFQSGSDCLAAVPNAADKRIIGAGIYCDVGETGGLVERNLIYGWNLNAGTKPDSIAAGVFWENRCHGATLQRNVIYNITGTEDRDSDGIRLNSQGCTSQTGMIVRHNSISGINKEGIYLGATANATVQNNIVAATPVGGTNSVAIIATPDAVKCGGHTINGNLYYANGDADKNGD